LPERNQADSQCNLQTALISERGSLGRILNYNVFKSDVSLMPSNIVKKRLKLEDVTLFEKAPILQLVTSIEHKDTEEL